MNREKCLQSEWLLKCASIIVYTHGYMFAYGKTGSFKKFSYWCQRGEVATTKFGQGNHVCVQPRLILHADGDENHGEQEDMDLQLQDRLIARLK